MIVLIVYVKLIFLQLLRLFGDIEKYQSKMQIKRRLHLPLTLVLTVLYIYPLVFASHQLRANVRFILSYLQSNVICVSFIQIT